MFTFIIWCLASNDRKIKVTSVSVIKCETYSFTGTSKSTQLKKNKKNEEVPVNVTRATMTKSNNSNNNVKPEHFLYAIALGEKETRAR